MAAQAELLNHLGIERLLAVSGGSMGGMQALSWAVKYPKRTAAVIAIASTARHSPQQIAFNEVGRQAILSDTNFNAGQYYEGNVPEHGLATARMIGHNNLHERPVNGRKILPPFAWKYGAIQPPFCL